MRTTSFSVRNTQKLEVFVEKLEDGFEIWIVGKINEQRIVLDHHLSHDDLERHLEYSKSGDLIWHDTLRSEIPAIKDQWAIEMEDTIKRGVFWDEAPSSHFDSIKLLAREKKDWLPVKETMLGAWTDGILNFTFESKNKLQWSCNDPTHWLNVGAQGPAPDWWNFALWGLAFMHGVGTVHATGMNNIGVLHVDDQELHIRNCRSARLAYIFHRDKTK
jgi:hypothetical protein